MSKPNVKIAAGLVAVALGLFGVVGVVGVTPVPTAAHARPVAAAPLVDSWS